MMEDLSKKLNVLKIQDEKTLAMKEDLKLEEAILDLRCLCSFCNWCNHLIYRDKIDAIMLEKTANDNINETLDLKIKEFNQKHEMYQNKQKEIVSKDSKIENNYDLLQQEIDRVTSERQDIIKKNENINKKIKHVAEQFTHLENEKNNLLNEDRRITNECEKIEEELENLDGKKGIIRKGFQKSFNSIRIFNLRA